MKEQTGQLAGEMATLREVLKAKLQQEFQEAIKQLSEVIIFSFMLSSWEQHQAPFDDT